jgi:probable phosphoglycerate mutase
MDKTRFGLIRHAVTEWNLEGRVQGQKDSRLSFEGKRHADICGKILSPFRFDRILSSDLSRAKETAERINKTLKVPLVAEKRLREQSWGDWEGKTLNEIRRLHDDVKQSLRNLAWEYFRPGGENRQSVWERCAKALFDASLKWPGERILVVTHGGVIFALLTSLSNIPLSQENNDFIKPRHLHWIAMKTEGLRIETINALELPHK